MGGRYISYDGGKNWQMLHYSQITAACRGAAPLFHPTKPGVIYALSTFAANRLHVSRDNGKTWTVFEPDRQPKTDVIIRMFVDPVLPERLFIGTIKGDVLFTDDEGKVWQKAQGVEGEVDRFVVEYGSPKERRVYFVGTATGVFRSDDGGKTWKKVSGGLGAPGVNMRVCRLILHGDGSLFALITAKRIDGKFTSRGPGLYRSNDGGKSWKLLTGSLGVRWPRDFALDPFDSRKIWLGAADIPRERGNREGGLYLTQDAGKHWKLALRRGPEHFSAAIHPKYGWIYATLCESAPGPALWVSKDGGKTWKPFAKLPFSNVLRVDFDPADPDIIYADTFGGSLWKGPALPSE